MFGTVLTPDMLLSKASLAYQTQVDLAKKSSTKTWLIAGGIGLGVLGLVWFLKGRR